MSKTYKVEEIKSSKRIKRQINQRGVTYEMLETLMAKVYPLKDFDLNLAIEELVIDACVAKGIISADEEVSTPEELYAKCLDLLQTNQKMTGSYFNTAQTFLTEIENYLDIEPVDNRKLQVNKSTAL